MKVHSNYSILHPRYSCETNCAFMVRGYGGFDRGFRCVVISKKRGWHIFWSGGKH